MIESVETQISEWRDFVSRSPAVGDRDLEELETHLRDQIAELAEVGLSDEEAFLVAVKRIGNIDELTHEFAREHSGRLWKQLVLSNDAQTETDERTWPAAVAFALATAIALQIALRIGGFPEETPMWLLRSGSLFVLPFLAGWFAYRRRLTLRQVLGAAIPYAGAAVLINAYPWTSNSQTELLAAAHVIVALWFVVAYPYLGGRLRSHEGRMDFVRFTGEWAIYYALIAQGGAILMGLTVGILEPAGVDAERIIEWVLPSGAAGAVIIGAWLVESKQRVVENMAPVLTMIFTPLFAVMLLGASLTYAVSDLSRTFDREVLGIFDAMLVVVFGLVLYATSARDPERPAGWMDRIQLVAVAGALVLDAMVLMAMIARIGDLGFTPNRTAALGLNLVLLVNLAVTAWLSTQFLRGRTTFHRLERWQTAYLPVFPAWAVVVVTVVPLLFRFA